MKLSPTIFLVALTLMLPCAPAATAQTNDESLDQVVQRATFEFSNEKVYLDEASWKGKIVSVSGVYVPLPVIGKRRTPHLQLTDRGSYGPINVVIYLDNPLPTTESYSGSVPLISTGERIRIVGAVSGVENFVDRRGYWLSLPVLDGIAIYRAEDQAFRHPLWISRTYQHE